MAGYKSSKELLDKGKNNLKEMSGQNKDLNETIASYSEEETRLNAPTSSRMQAIAVSEKFISSLQETSSLIEQTNSSLVGFKSALEGVASQATTATNCLLASSLVSLTQINSVLSAFRADFLINSSGGKADGTGYYDKNLLTQSLRDIKIQDRAVLSILKYVNKAANYANKSSNTVRSQLGNNTMAKDDDDESNGIMDKLLGGLTQAKGLAGLGAFLQLAPGKGKVGKALNKIGGKAANFAQADTSSIGGLLESLMSDKQKAQILDPLKSLGMDLGNKNDPLSQMLGDFMKKNGLSKSKKEKEKDPKLVMTSLAPFADDIKDMVEVKVKAMHARPTSIPDYATPVWVVNSEEQTDYVKNKDKTKDKELTNKRIDEIFQGVANNTKDKFGNDLLTANYGENGVTYSGVLADKYSKGKKAVNARNELNDKQKASQKKVYDRNHEESSWIDENGKIQKGGGDFKQAAEEFSKSRGAADNSGILGAAGSLLSGDTEGALNVALQSIMSGDGISGAFGYGKGLFNLGKSAFGGIKGSHKGGKKKGTGSKPYLVQVHDNERILGPDNVAEQTAINDTSKILGMTIGMLNYGISLTQMKNQLFIKYVNKEKFSPEELQTNNELLGADAIAQIGKVSDASEYLRTISDLKQKLSGKKQDRQLAEKLDDGKQEKKKSLKDIVKEKLKDAEKKLKDKVQDFLGLKEEEEKKDEEDKEKKVDEKKDEIDQQSDAEVSEYQEEKAQEVEDQKEEVEKNAQAQVAANQEKIDQQVEDQEKAQEQEGQAQVAANQERINQDVKQKIEEDNENAEERKKIIDKYENKINEVEKKSKMKALKIKIKGTKKALKEKMKGVKEAFNLSMLANIDLSNLSIDGIKEIIKDKINDIKRSLINKLKAKAKIILKSLTKKNLIETLKTEKTNLLERIKGMAHNASDIIETIGTGMGAAVDALEAVPIAGPALKLAAGIAAGTAVAGIGLAIKKAIDKGKEANVNADKETKKFEKSADKEKKKAEKEQEKKDKEKEKEENSKAKASTTQEKEKDDKDIDKTKDELDKFKTDDEKNGKAKPHKKGGLLGALLGGPKNDLLHYLNKNQIKALETGSKSKFANLMLKDPKKAANIIFMLNGGPMLLGFKDTKTEDLNNLESVTATNSNSNSSSSSKNTIWSKLKNKLSQKKLLSDDLSDEGYSQNIETAALQYEQTKNSANIISAFASGLGFAKLEDDSGTSLFTTTIRKTAQQEALTKNLGTATAASTTSTGTTAASTTSTDDDSSSSDNRFNGSKYIGYDEDGTWSNSTTNSDIDSSGYFSKSNSSSSKTLVTKILNNNWLKYKNDNNITDTTTTNGSSYPRKFLNSEYDKMYTAFISGVPFSGTTSKNYMHSKLASSISESDAWTVPDSIKNSDTEKNAVRDYINKKSGVKYTKYGLGISGLYGLGDENDEDFLDASGYALSKGYKEKDGGTYPQFFTDYLKKDNIEVENAGSVNKIKNRLASGSPVILMGKDESENGTTPYGAEPHYVVATGYDGKNIRVVDSESTNDYDIYNADKVLSHSSIKLGTTNSKKGKGRKVRSKSGRARKTSKNKKYDNKRTVGGSRTYSTTIIKSASDYGTSSSSKISNNYSKQNNSSRRVSNNRRKSYLKSGKGKYGRGYVEQINANPELLKGAQDGWTMYGILASVTLAQSIIESGFGTSNLAKNYHNWFGHTAGFASDKYMTGTYQGSHEWAVYTSDGDCFRDHAYVLSGQSGNTRYMAAVGEADPRASITAIENGGYCEGDPNSYIDKVMNIIDSYNLTQFDVGEYNGVAAGSGAVVYSKTCWTGDSRTEQMANYFSDLEVYATKGGQTIDYFNQHYSEISDKEGYNIFCWYGVNGATASGAQKTAEAYNKLATDLKGKSQVFAGTIGHCPNGTGSGKVEGGAGQSIETQNEGVVTFNTELLQNLSSDIIVIDTYTYIKSLEDSMGAEAMTTDNLHYTKECSQKIREYVNQQIQAASATTTTATSDAGVAIGDLYVTLEGYVDAKDILSQYASGDDIWDGVSSYNYADSSDYTSTAAANYDPTSSSEDDETSTATPTASSSSSSTPTSSSTPSSSDSTSSSTSSSTPSSSGSTSGSTNNPTTTTTTTTPTVSTPTDSNTSTEIYQSNGTLYVVNNIEYGIKANIADILKEFNELNDIQDDSLDVLNVIYQKLLKRNGKSKNTKIDGYDYSLKYRRFV